MLRTMTSHIGNLLLAGGAVLAVSFPSPQEATQAILDAVTHYPRVSITAQQDDVVIRNSDLSEPLIVSYDPATECMASASDMAIDTLTRCIDRLYEQSVILHHLPTAPTLPAEVLLTGRSTTPTEDQRLTISELCRALWTARNGDAEVLDMPGCHFAVAGVEQLAQME